MQWTWLFLLCSLAAGEDSQASENVLEAGCGGINVKAERDTINHPHPPKDCADVARYGGSRSGVYWIWPQGGCTQGIKVFCDLNKDGGGWTVVQRRGQFGNPQDYFYRRWRDYKFGFGDLEKEFWIGNDKLHLLSDLDEYVLRIDLTTHENETKHAQYDEFHVEDEGSKYRLWVDVYTGDAGDGMAVHNGMFFSTHERDNDPDKRNCPEVFKGAWWYERCLHSNLNGLNLNGIHKSYSDGIAWYLWKGDYYSFREVEMKIRPKSYP